MTAPRSIDAGLDWFLSHNANGSGMCAQHTWHSLGGDYGNPPAWGCANANQVYDKIKKSGRYWTKPRRGDIAAWKYGSNGHLARVYDDAGTKIATTNPSTGSSSSTGIEAMGYPSKWGATSSARIFTDTYNGVKCFDSTEDEDDDVKRAFLYLHTSDAIGDIGAGKYIKWDEEASDDAGFHSPDMAGIKAPWNSVGTWMVEGSGDAVLTFIKFNADDEKSGEIGRSVPGGDLTIVQDLTKGYLLGVLVKEGICPDARLKADIRER
jgi:hypothetical protein